MECEGFVFRYFCPDKKGGRFETKVNKVFKEAENRVFDRIRDVLEGRKDILEKLACSDVAIEIHLYQGTAFKDFENDVYFYGRTTLGGDEMILEFAADEVLYGSQAGHHAMDVVVHELMHLLDFYSDVEDGLLPGWKPEEVALYTAARKEEKVKIRSGSSIMDPYALTNNVEFLAVLGETFFTRGEALKESSPALYQIMKMFFRREP